jgi:hypothetical protein
MLALIILATGCGDGSGPNRPTIELSTARMWGLPVPLSFVAQAPELIVSGTIDVNEPCYDFSASLGGVRDTLIAWLRAVRRDGHCPQELARFSYTLTISGLEHGVQPLRVMYDYRGPPTFVQVAFEGAVDIQ